MSSTYIEMKIDSISFSKLGFIIFLKDKQAHTDEVLPLCIGANEAHSIAAVYNKEDFPRPLSHDLMKNILDTFECKISKVHISSLVDGTFYARIFFSNAEKEIDLDSRPSDAIALALRFEAPIFVHKDILSTAMFNVKEAYPNKQKVSTKEKISSPLEKLKKKLDQAIKKERYEDAAKIRDKIQSIESDELIP